MIVRVGPVVILAGLLACHSGPPGPGGVPLPAPAASATLKDSTGARIGVATLSAVDAGARLGVSVAGLPRPHGIHIHERACAPRPTSLGRRPPEPRGGSTA
jgi:Cu/Zn superoxide dismutase